MRDAIRLIASSELVLADVSGVELGPDYLLGVAHGLGRKVLHVTRDGDRGVTRGVLLLPIDDVDTSVRALGNALKQVIRQPHKRGPVAELLADEWAFGDRLVARRAVAFLMDIIFGAAMAGAYMWGSSWQAQEPFEFWFGLIRLTVFAWALLSLLTLVLMGSTPGMAVVSLRLISTEGGAPHLRQVLGGFAASLLAFQPLSGYWGVFLAPRYQSLEDALSGTRVVRRRR